MTRSWGPSSCTAEQQVAVPVGHCRCSFAGNGCVWPPSCFLPILFPPAVCWERGDRLQTQPRAVRGLSKGCLTSFCPTSPLSSNCGQWVVHNASWGRHSETQRGHFPQLSWLPVPPAHLVGLLAGLGNHRVPCLGGSRHPGLAKPRGVALAGHSCWSLDSARGSV